MNLVELTLARVAAAVKGEFRVRVNSTELGETREEEKRRLRAAGDWRRSEESERESLGEREAKRELMAVVEEAMNDGRFWRLSFSPALLLL